MRHRGGRPAQRSCHRVSEDIASAIGITLYLARQNRTYARPPRNAVGDN